MLVPRVSGRRNDAFTGIYPSIGITPDNGLRTLLETLDPKARDALRRVLIHDQADRDAIASQLLRYGDGHGDDWADIIDMLTMYPEALREVGRCWAS